MHLYVFFNYKSNKSNLPFFREIHCSLYCQKFALSEKWDGNTHLNIVTHRVIWGDLLIMN